MVHNDINGSLVSGFIGINYQVGQPEKLHTIDRRFAQRSHRSRSSSIGSIASSRNAKTVSRNRSPHKLHPHSNTSSLTESINHKNFKSYQDEGENKIEINIDSSRRKKIKEAFRPPGSPRYVPVLGLIYFRQLFYIFF